jgi:hypothetical protein
MHFYFLNDFSTYNCLSPIFIIKKSFNSNIINRIYVFQIYFAVLMFSYLQWQLIQELITKVSIIIFRKIESKCGTYIKIGTMKHMTADEVVRLFFHLVIKDHGCPENLLSDNGTQFMSEALTQVCRSFNINKLVASAYHHQTAVKVERFVRFFKNALAAVTPREALHK